MSNGNGSGNGGQPPESAFSIVNTLSLLIVGGYAAFMPLWMFYPPSNVKPEVLAIINQMMGTWSYAFAAVIGFHVGSSRSAKEAQQSNRDALATLSTSTAVVAAAAAGGGPAAPLAGDRDGTAPGGPAAGAVPPSRGGDPPSNPKDAPGGKSPAAPPAVPPGGVG